MKTTGCAAKAAHLITGVVLFALAIPVPCWAADAAPPPLATNPWIAAVAAALLAAVTKAFEAIFVAQVRAYLRRRPRAAAPPDAAAPPRPAPEHLVLVLVKTALWTAIAGLISAIFSGLAAMDLSETSRAWCFAISNANWVASSALTIWICVRALAAETRPS